MFKTKSIKVSEEIHSKLVAHAAYLTLQLKKKQSLNDAIEWLFKVLKEAKS